MAYKRSKKSGNGKGPHSSQSRSAVPDRTNGRVGAGNEGDDKKNASPAEASGDGRNDVSWYTRYPNLVAAAGTFPYPYRPGMDLQLGTIGTADSTRPVKAPIPGVMVLNWAPTVGQSQAATDPASVLGKEMYSRVRAAYSGTLRADAPDYVIYVLALDSIFSYIAWLKRLYRTMNVWSSENYVVPDTLLHAMGLQDPDILNLRADRTKLWQLINQLILQSRKFTCPGSLDIINRHYWMNDNVYTDADAINSQFYMFNQEYALKYFFGYFAGEDDPVGQVGGLIPLVMPWSRNAGTADKPFFALTPEFLYQYGLDMINALVAWDDAYTINGYLKRAYEGDTMFVVDELPIDATLQPVFSPEVLTQIENSYTIPCARYGTWTDVFAGLCVKQDPKTNAIISTPGMWIPSTTTSTTTSKFMPAGYKNLKTLLNSRSQMPGPLDNVIASRLISKVSKEADHISVGGTTKDGTMYYVDAASEVAISWHQFGAPGYDIDGPKFDGTESTDEILKDTWYYQLYDSSQLSFTAMRHLMGVSQYDWHPIAIYTTTASGGGAGLDYTPAYIYGDIHNPTTISLSELNNLHRVCLFSEFNSFSMG